MSVNEKQKFVLFHKLKRYFNNELKGKKIGVWGLAFKPNTDDVREAPALYIIDALIKEGAELAVFDPEATENVKKHFGDKINYCENAYDVAKDADALVIITEWSEFRNPDFDRLSILLKNKVIFDGRNVYDLEQMSDAGYYYESIGREIVK